MFRIGKNSSGVKEYLTKEQFEEILKNPGAHRGGYTSQQWAKIRKRINRSKREQSNG
jgi:hypothetical protein